MAKRVSTEASVDRTVLEALADICRGVIGEAVPITVDRRGRLLAGNYLVARLPAEMRHEGQWGVRSVNDRADTWDEGYDDVYEAVSHAVTVAVGNRLDEELVEKWAAVVDAAVEAAETEQ